MTEVQSLILNLSFPKSLEEVLEIQENIGKFDIEMLEDSIKNQDDIFEWNVSKWIKPDDIIFFMHSKRSIHTIIRLKNELAREQNRFSAKEIEFINKGLERGREIYDRCGGKIFAIGRVDESPVYHDQKDMDYNPHWKSRIYAYVKDCLWLDNPVDLSQFNTFIKLSCGGSITPVFGKEFEMLKELIARSNTIPDYLTDSMAMSIPLSRMNSENWIQIASKYRHSFMYEIQFRTFYVDYLLKRLGDRKKIYSECACKKKGIRTSFIDNVILFNGYYLPVEIKLAVKTEEDIYGQVEKYCHLEELFLDTKKKQNAPIDKVYKSNVLVIDTSNIFLYSFRTHNMEKICELAEIKEEKDILKVRQELISRLSTDPNQ